MGDSLSKLLALEHERGFSSDIETFNTCRSEKRQRMSPISVFEESKCCNPATAALEAALALDDIDFIDSTFTGANLPIFTSESIKEYTSKAFSSPFTYRKSCAVQTVLEVTRGMARMTTRNSV